MALRRVTNANRRGPSGSAAVWTPASLSGLVAWFDFSDTGTLTLATAEITAAANKGTDTTLASIVRGTTGPTLTTSGGRTYAQFSAAGSANRLTGTWAAASFAAAAGVSVFWTGANTAGSGSNGVFEAHTGAVNSGFNGYYTSAPPNTAGTVCGVKGKTSVLSQTQANLADTGWHQWDVLADTTNSVAAADTVADTTPGAAVTGDIVSVTDMMVGGLVGLFPGANAVGDLLVYNRRLSTTDRDLVRAYLKTKWATP